jgi:hypothetical protein
LIRIDMDHADGDAVLGEFVQEQAAPMGAAAAIYQARGEALSRTLTSGSA